MVMSVAKLRVIHAMAHEKKRLRQQEQVIPTENDDTSDEDELESKGEEETSDFAPDVSFFDADDESVERATSPSFDDTDVDHDEYGFLDDEEEEVNDDVSITPSEVDAPLPAATFVPEDDNVELTSTSADSVPLTNIDSNFSVEERCTYEIISLLDQAGAPRNLYDRLLALARVQKKSLGFNITNAISRERFLKKMQTKFRCPTLLTAVVSDCTVFRFPFTEMLQDLIDSRQGDIHFFDPGNDRTGEPSSTDTELWNTRWMHETFESYNGMDTQKEILLPLVIYMDKTGTDAYQRYSLEPVLFSLAAIKQEKREDRRSWRHLGFIPSTNHLKDKDSHLQAYHNCLGSILSGLKNAQEFPPTVRILRNGVVTELLARLPVMLIMGDQLSQDTLCARRKANSGGAGRVHRSCMCSYLTVDDPLHNCVKVDPKIIEFMTTRALMTKDSFTKIIDNETTILDKNKAKQRKSMVMRFLMRQSSMYSGILKRPFTTHPINNAFAGIFFGAWTSGLFAATFDDFMHSAESGLLMYIGTAIFGGLQLKERESLESKIKPLLSSSRSSIRSDYPRWRVQPGFSRQTLMTAAERVGNIFLLSLSLQLPSIRTIVDSGHERQRIKYHAFPPKKQQETKSLPAPKKKQKINSLSKKKDLNEESKGSELDYPYYYEQHFVKLVPDDVSETLEHLLRHGFDLQQLKTLDLLQINQLIVSGYDVFSRITYPASYPTDNIDGFYTDLGDDPDIPDDIVQLVHDAFNIEKRRKKGVLSKSRFGTVGKIKPKHLRDKPKLDGQGSTSAVLCNGISLIFFLEYVLCYQSFCKYSSNLPPELRNSFEVVEFGGRSLIRYFERMIYRGDNTLDARTTKTHAQMRTGWNYLAILSLMHATCETGERLLKTEAKGISKTAQQRGASTFERQTCCRVQDKLVMDKFGEVLEELLLLKRFQEMKEGNENSTTNDNNKSDQFNRHLPHFILQRVGKEVMASDRAGKLSIPDEKSGYLDPTIVTNLLTLEPGMDMFEIYTEVKLRNDSLVRAVPNYRKSGPWYDFVNVQYEGELLPARALCFYRKKEEEGVDVPYALVHGIDKKRKMSRDFVNSLLTTHYHMHYRSNTKPVINSIPVASIDCAIMAFLHEPSELLFDANCSGIMAVRHRNEWAYLWLAWNEELRAKNGEQSEGKKNNYVSLADANLLRKVRDNAKKKLEIPKNL
jgi:hypothetical protein